MKTIEEKAKAYDEAIKRAKEFEKGEVHFALKPGESIVHWIFPELRESEDERMIREFNDWLCEEIECRTNDLRDEKDRRTLNMLCYVLTKVKDWLEKRKEQKPTSFNEPYNSDEYEVVMEGNATSLKRKEQKPAWNEEDEQFLLVCKNALRKYQISDHWDANIISKWLEERIKSPRPQPKQEWSEEDEKKLELVIDCIYEFYPDPVMKYKLKDWLTSLRPSWKPSWEQMEALEVVVRYGDKESTHIKSLRDLYEQLKKL